MERAGEGKSVDEGEIRALAARHGLELEGPLAVNELGLDYRVVIAAVGGGTRWVLRIPRRDDVREKVEKEARALAFFKRHLPFAVPDWQVATPELIAYPLLTDTTAMVIEPGHEPELKIAQDSVAFAKSYAKALAALHTLPVDEAAGAGMEIRDPAQARQAVARDVDRVKRELPVGPKLLERWQRWLDDDGSWPDFTVPIHGDLYVGHVLVDEEERVTGMIDWSEAKVDDPSIDLTSHLMVFGEAGLRELLEAYEAAGGRTWPRMAAHVEERRAAYPVAYAIFALESGDETHRAAVLEQLAGDG